MQLQQQVVSLQLAQRLKELGVAQESYFFWNSNKDLTERWIHKPKEHFALIASAYTVAELGVMLGGMQYYQSYAEFWYKLGGTEAEGRAASLIHLLENGQLPIEEVNQRLTK